MVNNFIFFTLFIIAVVVSVWVVLSSLFSFGDKKAMNSLDEYFAKQKKISKDTELRLTTSLKCICSQLSIPISYHEDLGDAAGKILYNSFNDKISLDNARIEILNKYENEPFVLAHELGHYFALKQRCDRTEDGADREALILCKSILTQQESEIMAISLQCYFEKNLEKDIKEIE